MFLNNFNFWRRFKGGVWVRIYNRSYIGSGSDYWEQVSIEEGLKILKDTRARYNRHVELEWWVPHEM